jgi:hypothetical protein
MDKRYLDRVEFTVMSSESVVHDSDSTILSSRRGDDTTNSGFAYGCMTSSILTEFLFAVGSLSCLGGKRALCGLLPGDGFDDGDKSTLEGSDLRRPREKLERVFFCVGGVDCPSDDTHS